LTTDRTGTALVRTAREFVGVPFRHNTASDVLGCDCAGLILGAARKLGITSSSLPKYGRDVPPATLLVHLKAELEPVWSQARLHSIVGRSDAEHREEGWEAAQPGDVLCLNVASEQGDPHPRHLAYWTGDGLLHVVEKHGVVETPLDRRWRRRLHSVWRWKSLEGG
jgi:cell wall-associated NlpC family hydrolase